ncbi:hypothetical protein CXF59_14555 [Flavobacterium sp. ALD4]|uniref:hypothetical protein n=1 Tax=Flavobacterium sp. ALD4 TaxID=2058314 RepID=UPI000C32CF70|nr:hypothetical protein [Flavobacterium sp. ALD4]PKH67109.1 hypothetical protein CXF59_14555 [Flavobacterium sp. ALD4]
MKKLITFFFLFSLSVAFGQNQKIYANTTDTLNVVADDFIGYDQFDFYYYIKDNALYKIKGTTSLEYKNPSLGKITKIDIQNPLNIVLFYENFNVVILLDNQLNETQKINFLENTSPLAVSATGIASQNRLWAYNSLNQQIGLFDYIKNEYKTISTPFPENIKHYQTDFNTFYWIDHKNNWYSCDVFGVITTRGKTPGFDAIEIMSDHQFIYSNNNKLFFEDLEKNQKYEIEISEKTFKKFYYRDQILSIFTSKGIINYKITTP